MVNCDDCDGCPHCDEPEQCANPAWCETRLVVARWVAVGLLVAVGVFLVWAWSMRVLTPVVQGAPAPLPRAKKQAPPAVSERELLGQWEMEYSWGDEIHTVRCRFDADGTVHYLGGRRMGSELWRLRYSGIYRCAVLSIGEAGIDPKVLYRAWHVPLVRAGPGHLRRATPDDYPLRFELRR